MKTIQIPLSKWAHKQGNSEGLPPETTTRKTLVSPSYSCCPGNIIQPKDKTENSLPAFLPLHNPPPHPVGSSPKPLMKSDILFYPPPCPHTHTVTSLFWAVQMYSHIYNYTNNQSRTNSAFWTPDDPATFSREPSRKLRPEVLRHDPPGTEPHPALPPLTATTKKFRRFSYEWSVL